MSRIGSWLVLSFRLNRWEVLASAAGVALLSAGMLWFTWQLRTLAAAEPRCLDPMTYVAACELSPQAFYELSSKAEWLSYLAWVAPFGMGLLLGVPLVSREVEHRTAGVAWTLSRSRRWWLVRRAAFLIVVLVVLLLVIAVMGGVLASAQMPTRHLDRDFAWYGRRGGLIVVRGLASLGIGVLVGAWLGRVMPALLVGIATTVLIFSGISLGMDRWIEGDAIVNVYGGPDEGGRYLGQRVELHNGELIDYGELQRRGLSAEVFQDDMIFASPEDVGHPERMIGRDRGLILPGRLYPQIVLRESAVVGGTAVLLALTATAVVGRRRPG
ncbi:MAG TPA: hypothetical protein VJZ50_03360 [Candidatus Limnocylindrales bacterium]|nr:hypothetical protein [Candidatus Limnocylindrales bacterium]